jgi:hypothetical protein
VSRKQALPSLCSLGLALLQAITSSSPFSVIWPAPPKEMDGIKVKSPGEGMYVFTMNAR